MSGPRLTNVSRKRECLERRKISPLSLWERVRVRAGEGRSGVNSAISTPLPSSPGPLPKGEGSFSRHALIGVALTVLMALTTAAPATRAAESPPNPNKNAVLLPILDECLSEAMNNNPNIIAAKAQVALDEAKLNSVRLEVARQIIDLHAQVIAQYQLRDSATMQLDRADALYKRGNVPLSEFESAKTSVINANAKLAALETELRFQMGKAGPVTSRSVAQYSTGGGYGMQNASTDTTPAQREQLKGPIVEKVLAALDKTIEVDFSDTPLEYVFAYLKERTGITFMLDPDCPLDSSTPVSLSLKEIPLGALLQALEDKTVLQQTQIVVRSYGLFLTTKDNSLQRGYTPALELWNGVERPKTSPTPGSLEGGRRGKATTGSSTGSTPPTMPIVPPAPPTTPTQRSTTPSKTSTSPEG
jgi:hypothetical protein